MFTYQEDDSVLDALSSVSNFRYGYYSGRILLDTDIETSVRGLPEFRPSNAKTFMEKQENGENYEDDDIYIFDMGCQPYIPEEKKKRWKKAIVEFCESGANVPEDVPDYVFTVKNVSYEGSTDYFVIYEKHLVML